MGDFSCNITIINNLDVQLTYISKGNAHGYWNIDPPSTINANSTAQFGTKDYKGGIYGSDGWVNYRVEMQYVVDEDKPVIKVSFNCPTGYNDNTFNMVASAATSIFQFTNSSFQKREHPLTVTGTIAFNTSISTSSTIASIVIPNPKLNIYNSKGELYKTTNLELWNKRDPASFEDDSTRNVTGSYRPVSFDIRQDCHLYITIDIDDNLVGIPFYISGKWRTYHKVISSDEPQFSKSAGSITVKVEVFPDWADTSFPWGLVGNIIWHITLAPTNQAFQLNSSRLELYALTPTLPTFFSNRVQVAVLRAIVYPARDVIPTARDWATYFTQAAFDRYGFKFFDGTKAFAETPQGGNFQLKKWCSLLETGTNVSCHDQTGILQIGIGLAPNGGTQWQYLQPYGYIPTCGYLSISECNNPFCRRDNDPPILGANDKTRSRLDFHTFITVFYKSNFVADATIGPHLVTESISDYISSSIETETDTALYTYNGVKPGTVADVKSTSGVTSVDLYGYDPDHTDSSVEAASTSAALYSKLRLSSPFGSDDSIPFTNFDVGKLHTLLTENRTQGGSQVLYHSYDITPSGSHIEWVFGSHSTDGGDQSNIQIFIADSATGANKKLETHLKGNTMPPEVVFEPAPKDLSKGYPCLITSPVCNDHSEMIWVRGNVFTSVSGQTDIHNLDNVYLKGIDKVYMDGAARPKGEVEWKLQKPIIEHIRVPRKVKVGEEFTAYASVANSHLSNVYNGKNDIVVLLSKDVTTHTFKFRAEMQGVETLVFMFAHSITGVVTTERVKLEVQGVLE